MKKEIKNQNCASINNPKFSILIFSFSICAVSFFILIFAFCIISVPSSVSAFTLTSGGNNLGLVGWWTMDGKDVVNGVARDLSGQGNHGNLSGIATSTFYKPGKIGQGFNFDGTDDYVGLGNILNFEKTDSFSIFFWAKYTQLAGGNFVSKQQNSGGFGGYGIGLNGSGKPEVYILGAAGGTGAIIDYPNAKNDNLWHQIGFTYNGNTLASGFTIYVDGVSLSKSIILDNLSGTMQTAASFQIIGRGGANNLVGGSLDDVRIYNRTLSAAEIKNLYNQGAATKQNTSFTPQGLASGLVGHWTFDGKDVVNGVARDMSGQGNHANLVSIATSTFYKPGKIGQGFNFDGVDDYVDAGTGLNTTFIGSDKKFTISVWEKLNSVSVTQTIISNYARSFTFLVQSGLYRFTVINDAGTNSFDLKPTVVPTVGKWNHHIIVYDGSIDTSGLARVNWYINGSLQSTSVYTNPWDSPFDIDGVGTVTQIGATVGGTFMNGTLDDVRIYNRVLTAAEIKQLYNQGAATKQSNTFTPQGLASGLVGHWTMDGKDVVNGVARDMSGQGNHGNLANIATSTFYKPGKIGQGFNFDGVDDYVNVGDAFYSDRLTLCAWVNPRIIDSNARTIVTKRNTAANPPVNADVEWSLTLDSANNFRYFSWDSADAVVVDVSSSVVSIANKWYHVCVAQNGNGNPGYFYLNGAQTSSYTQVGVMKNTTASIQIAARTGDNNNRYFNGSLDDVHVYNRALSAAEIKQLYNMGR